MFDADASSTAVTPSRAPEYHTASTSSCSASDFRQRIPVAGDDVDHAGGHVRRLEHAVEVGRRERIRLRRNRRRSCCRSRSPARRARSCRAAGASSGARDADHADRLVHRDRDAANRHAVHRAVVLVGPRGVGEQPRDRRVDFLLRALRRRTRSSRRCAHANSSRARREILGDVVEDLRAVVSRRARPPARRMRRFDGVANVLAIALRATSPTCAPDGDDDAAV